MKLIIGLTGPTGSGKSSVSAVAEKMGFKVIDCDKLARKAAQKGTEGLIALVKAFGLDILDSNGNLNRPMLAKKAFSSKEKTELLNKTFLPFVIKLVLSEAADSEKVLLDAPTLFESGLENECNATIAVLSEKDIRLKRIMERDGIDKSSALLRMNAGKSDEFYKQNADHIIYNNKDLSFCETEFKKIINSVLGKI